MKLTTLEPIVANLRLEAAQGPDTARIAQTLEGLHYVDVAHALDALTLDETRRVFDAMPQEVAAYALLEVDPDAKAYLVRHADRERIAQILDELPMDDAVELFEDLKPEEIEPILRTLPATDAAEVRDLLAYPEKSAGRLMTEKFAAVRREMTLRQVLQWLRTVPRELETVNDLYVLTADGILTGVCSLRDIVTNDPAKWVGDVMTTELVSIGPLDHQREVATLIERYDFLAMPVVDGRGRMLGIVTVDDVIDVLTEEFTEDIAKFAGTDAEAMDKRSPLEVAKLRFPWLIGTMVIELMAGGVISIFDDTLKKVILLASFMPVISAISGNVGLQSAAIVVRGLDTGHIAIEGIWKAVRKEFLAGLALAGCLGLVLGIVGAIWSHHWPFGVVVGSAMTCSILTAGFMGTVIPIMSKKLGFDPAATAGPFETAFQDVVGFAVFLWLATLLLQVLK